MFISFKKTKGSCGQVRFALWYPISIDEFIINLFLTPFPNESDTSPFHLSFLDLSCSAVSIQSNQTNKHLYLITSLKPLLKAHKINLCKTNNLRYPSLRAGGLDPLTLNIGSDVALSFDFPIYQNTGHQHSLRYSKIDFFKWRGTIHITKDKKAYAKIWRHA